MTWRAALAVGLLSCAPAVAPPDTSLALEPAAGEPAPEKEAPAPARWSVAVDAGDFHVEVNDVAIDGAGRVAVVGRLDRVVRIAGVEITCDARPNEAYHASVGFVVVLDARGEHVWHRAFGTSDLTGVSAAAFDADGHLAIAGDAYGELDLGGGALAPGGDSDVFVAKLASDGRHLWSHRFGDHEAQHLARVAVGDDGDVYLSAFFYGSLDAGAGAIPSNDGNSLVARFAGADGSLRWARGLGEHGPAIGGVAVASDGGVVIGGDFAAALSASGRRGDSIRAVGLRDAFVVALDGEGRHRWSRRYGELPLMSHRVDDVALLAEGPIAAIGQFEKRLRVAGSEVLEAPADASFLLLLGDDGKVLERRVLGQRPILFVSHLASRGTRLLAASNEVADEDTMVPAGRVLVLDGSGHELGEERFPQREVVAAALGDECIVVVTREQRRFAVVRLPLP